MKLDAQSEAHKISAHQYDKLQSLCEFSSGKMLLFGGENEDGESSSINVAKNLNMIETKIKEIKNDNLANALISIGNYINKWHIEVQTLGAIN